MKGNKLKKTEKKKGAPVGMPEPLKNPGFFARTLRNILGGAYLESEQSFHKIPFLLFVALLAMMYITNSYMIENKMRNINKLQNEVNEYRYEYITLKTDLMTLSRQSNLSKKLEAMGIKENMEPVKTITIYTNKEK